MNAVSRALRLDYYHLKRHAAGRQPLRRPASLVFVELDGPRTEAGLACVVELEKGNGARMRICVRDVAGVDWGKLKEAFLGA